MNFLEMTEELRWRSGSSSMPITSFTSMKNHEHRRFKDWINQAWADIQIKRDDWYFRRRQSSYVIPVEANILSTREWEAGDVAKWTTHDHQGNVMVRMADPGEGIGRSGPLFYEPWECFSAGIGLDPAVYGKPTTFSIRPHDNALVVAPSADQPYVFYLEHIRGVQELVDEQDTPIMPKDYHLLIVFQALLDYGQHEAAQDAIQTAIRGRRRMIPALERSQLPPVVF